MFRQVNSTEFSVIYHYIQVVEDCARESMAKARRR